MEKRKRRLLFLLLFLAVSVPIIVTLPPALQEAGNVQDPCSCNNVTTNFVSFDTSDIPPFSNARFCSSETLPNGNIAVLMYPDAVNLYYRVYQTDGTLVSSFIFDQTGSGQWQFSSCNDFILTQNIETTNDGVYVVYQIDSSNFRGTAIVRLFLNGTLDTSIGTNGYLRTGPIIDYNGDPANFQNPNGVFSNEDSIFIIGYYNLATPPNGGFITKLSQTSLTKNATFGINGDVFISNPNVCGGISTNALSVTFDDFNSRILLGLRNCIQAFDLHTGILDVSYGVNGGYQVGTNSWNFDTSLRNQSIWSGYYFDGDTFVQIISVAPDGNSSISSGISNFYDIRQAVGPSCSPTEFAQVQYTTPDDTIYTLDFFLNRRSDLTNVYNSTVGNFQFHSFVFVPQENAYYIFEFRGATLTPLKVSCLAK